MGKLKKISFAGLDDYTMSFYTSRLELRKIQEEYPMVEYGVLMSLHWYENGRRYLNPRCLEYINFNVCAHFCGQMAKDALLNDWRIFEAFVGPNKKLFNRAQLNIAPYSHLPYINHKWDYKNYFDSIIIQQKPDVKYDTSVDFQRIKTLNEELHGTSNVDILLDGSGGTGLESEFKPYPHKFVGYAGGINPDNVVDKVKLLVDNPEVGDFWIDMESGIRSEENNFDYFDIKKVEKVLTNLKDANLI